MWKPYKFAKRESGYKSQVCFCSKMLLKKCITSIEWQTCHHYRGKLYTYNMCSHQSTLLSAIKKVCSRQVTLKSSQSSVISSNYEQPIEVWPSSMNLIFHTSPGSELWDFSTRNSLIFSTHRQRMLSPACSLLKF